MTAAGREQRVLSIIETARSKRPRFRDERITMAHGAGGKATATLVEGLLAPAFGMAELDDAGPAGDEHVVSTDSFVVKPLRFPGGAIVAGDTKVVERGHADGMYVCTTGVGRRDPRASLSPSGVRPGDRILLSGSIGEHGTAIMLARNEFELDADVESDTRSLWPAVDALLGAA